MSFPKPPHKLTLCIKPQGLGLVLLLSCLEGNSTTPILLQHRASSTMLPSSGAGTTLLRAAAGESQDLLLVPQGQLCYLPHVARGQEALGYSPLPTSLYGRWGMGTQLMLMFLNQLMHTHSQRSDLLFCWGEAHDLLSRVLFLTVFWIV